MEYDRTPPSQYKGPHKRLRGAFGGYGTSFCPRDDRDICLNDPYSCLEESLSTIPYKEYCPCDFGKPFNENSSSSSSSSSSNSNNILEGNKISKRSHKNYNKTHNDSYPTQNTNDRRPIQIKDQTIVHKDPWTEDIKIKHISSKIKRKK